jgi:hypothetical protein
MIALVLVALSLVAATVLVHVLGLTLLMLWLVRLPNGLPLDFWPFTWLFVRLVWALLLIHGVEIWIWAAVYHWGAHLPDMGTALYFSGVTYTGIGYGDVLVERPWRILAPIEGLTGIVMCSLSAAFFFAVLSRVFIARQQRRENRASSGSPAC